MNEQNLRPKLISTTEEAKRLGSAGGKASAKARREKKIISSIYIDFLLKKTKSQIDGKSLTGKQLLDNAVKSIITKGTDAAKVALMKEMREALEGSNIKLGNQGGEPLVIENRLAEYQRLKEQANANASEPEKNG